MCFCKLDIEKMYDHINWNYLLLVYKNGFQGEVGWLDKAVHLYYEVFCSCQLSSFFHNSRGLRQRDTLSPYLFVIGMEALSNLIKRAMGGVFLSRCRVKGKRGGEGVQISYLLFANDILVFCDALQD